MPLITIFRSVDFGLYNVGSYEDVFSMEDVFARPSGWFFTYPDAANVREPLYHANPNIPRDVAFARDQEIADLVNGALDVFVVHHFDADDIFEVIQEAFQAGQTDVETILNNCAYDEENDCPCLNCIAYGWTPNDPESGNGHGMCANCVLEQAEYNDSSRQLVTGTWCWSLTRERWDSAVNVVNGEYVPADDPDQDGVMVYDQDDDEDDDEPTNDRPYDAWIQNVLLQWSGYVTPEEEFTDDERDDSGQSTPILMDNEDDGNEPLAPGFM